MDIWGIGVKILPCLLFIGLERLTYKEHCAMAKDYNSALTDAGVDPLKAACMADEGNALVFSLLRSFMFICAMGLGQYIWRN